MDEAPAVASDRHVGDDVEGLVRLGERTFHGAVEVGADDDRVRHTALAANRRELGKEAVDSPRNVLAVEKSVQLVVQWADPTGDGCVLRDLRQFSRILLRTAEGLGEPGSQ